MTIELSTRVEKELRDLAAIQSRDIGEIVEDAIRQYLESATITDKLLAALDAEPDEMTEADWDRMRERVRRTSATR